MPTSPNPKETKRLPLHSASFWSMQEMQRWLQRASPDADDQRNAFGTRALLLLLASIVPAFLGR
jgi:hypothetical protein